DTAVATGIVVDGELDLGTAMQRAARGRPPALVDMALADVHLLPLAREVIARAADPPHVVAAGIHQLERQVIGGRFGTQPEPEAVVSRVVELQVALDAGITGHAVEVVVQAQRPALRALDPADAAADLVGRNNAPGG